MPAIKKKRILLVDDKKHLLDEYKQVLEANGFEVITALNVEGKQGGIEKFSRFKDRIDMVITDWEMKGANGL